MDLMIWLAFFHFMIQLEKMHVCVSVIKRNKILKVEILFENVKI